jgi:hypothetical protein
MKKELNEIFASIKIMDFDMLLNDYPKMEIYPKNSTKIFSKKINAVFDILKSNGDTVLNIRDCTRICDCGTCTPNYNKYNLAFVGNISGDYFGLTVSMDKNFNPYFMHVSTFFDYSIKHCATGRFDETTKGQKFSQMHSFFISEDELDNFIPHDDYLDAILLKKIAIADLENNANTVEDIEWLKNWLLKYKSIILNTNKTYELLFEFKTLYNRLSGYLEYLDHIEKVKSILDEINNDKRYNPGNMLEWLLKHESYFKTNFHMLQSYRNEEDDYFEVYEISSIKYKISKDIFKELLPFINFFKDNYDEHLYYWREAYLEKNNMTLDDVFKNDIGFEYSLSNFYNLMT